MHTSAHIQTLKWAWMRNPTFDLWFIVGIPSIACLVGAIVVSRPDWFLTILLIDLWVLGYHHVISTYTRICFDRKSLEEHRNLIIYVFPAVALATAAMAIGIGIWTVLSTYFYWQWFHYARQSWGISRAYQSKSKGSTFESGWVEQAIFYSMPVLGIAYRSYQNPGTFIGMELRTFPIPWFAVLTLAIATGMLLLYWAYCRWAAWRAGTLSPVHTVYMLTHFLIFFVGYILISDITFGWLVINIWHNAQYILFVWMFNTKKFKSGVDPEAYFISYISQPGRFWLYMTSCLLITGFIYVAIIGSLTNLFVTGLSATIVLYQIVNFHHYIVDSVIWKVRKEPIRKVLGIPD